MTHTHKNECPVAAGQNVKTLSKRATYFIATCTHLASLDAALIAVWLVLALNVWGVL